MPGDRVRSVREHPARVGSSEYSCRVTPGRSSPPAVVQTRLQGRRYRGCGRHAHFVFKRLNGDQQAGDALARRGGWQIQQMRQTGIFRCRKGVALTVEIGVPGDACAINRALARPCGTRKTPPRAWARLWVIPSDALVKAIPAMQEALCIFSRACRLSPLRQQVGR